MSKQMIVWGVRCRACSAPVAFGSPSHQQFELESIHAKQGAIRCASGHTYIYFPRDFKFFMSDDVISEAMMRKNREAHSAINPPAVTPSDQFYGTRWVPNKEEEADSQGARKAAKDTPEETEQFATVNSWANCAVKKMS